MPGRRDGETVFVSMARRVSEVWKQDSIDDLKLRGRSPSLFGSQSRIFRRLFGGMRTSQEAPAFSYTECGIMIQVQVGQG